MIHIVLAKQAGRHESSCTINVMCTKEKDSSLCARRQTGHGSILCAKRRRSEPIRMKEKGTKTKLNHGPNASSK